VKAPASSPRRGIETAPALKSLHPAAARWIGALIRMTSGHPAMSQILDVIERLSERPYRTNFVLLGEPGTGKEGLGRALAHLSGATGPLVRLDVAGFPEDDALEVLCGAGKRAGVAEVADGGTILIEELSGIGPRLQAALLRLLKSGRCERRDTAGATTHSGARPGADEEPGGPGKSPRRFDVHAIAMSDRDLEAEVASGRLRHDLYYRLARVVLWLPPLRERIEDVGPAAIWMGNRILEQAGVPLELMGMEELRRASPTEKSRAIALEAEAVAALQKHAWPGNFRELEAVLERALLLYRRTGNLGADEVARALAAPSPPPAPRPS
jgi:DNA-binding NtrC family response regulator